MKLFVCELKKIIEMPLLWIFLALCIGFNMILLFSDANYFDYPDYVAEGAHKTGYKLDSNFYSELDKLSASDLKYLEISPTDDVDYEKYMRANYNLMLINDTVSPTDVFEGYDVTNVAETYIEGCEITNPRVAKAMREKFKNAQKYVEKLDKTDESLTLYFAGYTSDEFANLFGSTMRTILMEGILLASLVMLFSAGYENMCGTEALMYSTRKGRNVLFPKLGASLVCALAGYALITLITLTVYFLIHDYSAILNSSVSSCFNYWNDLISGVRPFVTCGSFTIWQYLLAGIGISLIIVIFFVVFAFAIGTLVRNTYIAFGTLLVLNVGTFVLTFMLSVNNIFKYLLCCTPIDLWYLQATWFTDGGGNVLFTHFETLGSCISLAVICILGALMFRLFKRRDI